eukprot:1997414-Pyramimonas_sp.AAC.1
MPAARPMRTPMHRQLCFDASPMLSRSGTPMRCIANAVSQRSAASAKKELAVESHRLHKARRPTRMITVRAIPPNTPIQGSVVWGP